MLQSIKSLLVGLTEEGKNEASSAFGYGLSLANAAEAHLTVQAASLKLLVPGSVISDFGADLVLAENQRADALATTLTERIRGDAAFAGVTCTVKSPHLSYQELLDAFVMQARVHDLSILDAEERAFDMDRDLIEAVLFKSGRPALIVPAGCRAFSCRRIIVAWDGSAVAARALNDAMPFLREAQSVELVSVVGEKDLSRLVPGSEVAPHLDRHGVKVTVKDLRVGPDGVAATLFEQAGLYRADMLVMGAFKHSRVSEWFLGGVTQSLLRRSPVPLFLSH